MGEDLGIIGDEQTFDPQLGKPLLALSLVNLGQVLVGWKKGDFEGVRIEVDRGAGWVFLAIDTTPDYLDTHPTPATATVWKYRAAYLYDDQTVGSWSDVAQITVG